MLNNRGTVSVYDAPIRQSLFILWNSWARRPLLRHSTARRAPPDATSENARNRLSPITLRPPGTIAGDPLEKDPSHRVKARILIPFALVLAFVIAMFLVGSYLFQSRVWDHDLAATVRRVETMTQHEIRTDTGMMRAILKLIMDDHEVQAAFLTGNRDRLLSRLGSFFEKLKNEDRISLLYITRPDREAFLRVHEPALHGDIVDRFTMVQAARTGAVSSGIELGVFGTLTLRVVKPWLYEGRVIGFMELGHEIAHFVQELRESLGLDFLVLVDKRYLDANLWRQGVTILGHQWSWDRFPSMVVAGQTTEALPEALTRLLEKDEPIPSQILRAETGNRHLHVAFLPLADAAARSVGYLVLVRDVTALDAGFRNTMLWIVGLSLLVGLTAFLLFYVILDKVERTHRRQRAVEQEFDKLSIEHRRVVQMEKLSAVGLMMGEIAHQINNPLVGVLNMAQLADREADNPKLTRELLTDIRKAGEHCRAFVQRMLEFTAISRSDRRPTDLRRLIQETISLFQQSTGDHVEIECELPPLPVTADVDPVLIRHALFNLLSNAQQAMANMTGAKITVSLCRDLRADDRMAGWSISVRDRGPGLTPDVAARMFTPFFSTRPDGTGMGLPVVQHIAALHDGHITAGNNPDGGANFALWLPAMSAVWVADPTSG